jgi:hypothetical protein
MTTLIITNNGFMGYTAYLNSITDNETAYIHKLIENNIETDTMHKLAKCVHRFNKRPTKLLTTKRHTLTHTLTVTMDLFQLTATITYSIGKTVVDNYTYNEELTPIGLERNLDGINYNRFIDLPIYMIPDEIKSHLQLPYSSTKKCEHIKMKFRTFKKDIQNQIIHYKKYYKN